jgi:hypothetical protein
MASSYDEFVRTTLSIDDDVAAAIRRRQAARGTGLKREINELLRARSGCRAV